MNEILIAWAILQTGLLLLIARELHNINRRARAREAAETEAQRLAESLKPCPTMSFDEQWEYLNRRFPSGHFTSTRNRQ